LSQQLYLHGGSVPLITFVSFLGLALNINLNLKKKIVIAKLYRCSSHVIDKSDYNERAK
jgi:hypothetical protein